MTDNKKLIIAASVFVSALLALILIWFVPFGKEPLPTEAEAAIPEETKVTFKIKAVGDNLIHSPIFKYCKTEEGYDFDGCYKNIKKYIKDADVAAINQETIFVDEKTGYTGYPAFGSPHQVGESVVEAGFNVVTHATNHTYDKGYNGLMYTMDFWDTYPEVKVLGVNRSEEEQNTVEIVKKGDLSVAMLNFTYGINGRVLPSDEPYLVNLLTCGELEESLLKKAEESADVTVVFVHYGTEYVHAPTEEQIKTVDFLCSNGADIIIGTHPHVVQPVAKHVSENGNEAVVYYSLGNFLSNQEGAERILGAMADVTITKENGEVKIESYEMHPLVSHCSDRKHTVYMLEDYTDDLASKHTRAPGLTVEKIQSLYDEIVNINVY